MDIFRGTTALNFGQSSSKYTLIAYARSNNSGESADLCGSFEHLLITITISIKISHGGSNQGLSI